MRELLDTVREWQAQGAALGRAVVVRTFGSAPRPEGANLVVTADGRLLARIYSESDLLVAECLRTGVWKGLQPAELAAAPHRRTPCAARLTRMYAGKLFSGPPPEGAKPVATSASTSASRRAR